ncbi:MAG: hypothetical protein Q8M96_14870 [Rubrivivax sp.]|nr:hypothetical protein [Rubrivivax sp.]
MSRGGMQLESRLMWRLVRDSQPHGVPFIDLQAASRVAKENANFRLKFMCSSGYLTLEPGGEAPMWRLGDKLPRGESWMHGAGQVEDAAAPAPAPAAAAPTPSATKADNAASSGLNWVQRRKPGTAAEDPDDGDDEADFRAKAAPKGVPRGVPNSVFALGGLVAGSVGTAAAAGADAVSAVVHGAVTSASDAAATALQRVTGGPVPDMNARVELEERELFISAAHHSDRALPQTLNPRFELHSDNLLVIHLSGDDPEPISLPATVTRALFRWLDRQGGTQLARLTEEATT